jgi:hypothetical protein
MKKEDELKTSFITPSGTYCYLRMPEGLKNAGGSFSRMTTRVLHSQIGRNVLTYVDDIIVKSMKQENHIADLQDTFANFRQVGLKLNPEKCVFRVKKGKFLGCLVSTKGIEANPRKIEAILRMEPPSTKKWAQRLAGRLASLNRFISISAKRNLPFFEIMKSTEVFQWGPAQQKAFEELKQYLIDLTTLTPPSPGAPLLLYVAAKSLRRIEGIELMKEIHVGLCGSHIGSRPLLGKVFRQGFYWPKTASDAVELVQKCENCQKCARDQKQPSSLTQLIQPTWPLQRWGLDLLGPLPPAQGNLRYVVGAVEYFSKWIEAKPLATITSVTVQKFLWQNIVCRFGVPKAITVDSGTQFDAKTFKDFCDQNGTKINFASIRHPESNGLVERANGIIMTGIMKLIFNQPRGKWADELIKVVWSHNTTISRSTGFTPFKLLFGDEAITPEEAKAGSIRTAASTEDEADYHVAKDTIEGYRLQAMENINKYQAETIKWRDRKVRLKNIKPGHLVLRRVANPDTVGKLQLKWEGPFLVVSSSRPGSYRLKDMDGNDIPRSWNADELRRYYV